MPESDVHPTTYIPAVLLVGDHRIAMDEWPLTRAVEERGSLEIQRPNADLLTIEPKARSGAVGAISLLLVVLGGLLPAIMSAVVEGPWWIPFVSSLVALALLLLLVRDRLSHLRWIRLDRKAGQLVIERRVGFRRKSRVDCLRPLESIRAVQLLFTGRHSVTEPQGAGCPFTVDLMV